jgi:hypothetical protein
MPAREPADRVSQRFWRIRWTLWAVRMGGLAAFLGILLYVWYHP